VGHRRRRVGGDLVANEAQALGVNPATFATTRIEGVDTSHGYASYAEPKSRPHRAGPRWSATHRARARPARADARGPGTLNGPRSLRRWGRIGGIAGRQSDPTCETHRRVGAVPERAPLYVRRALRGELTPRPAAREEGRCRVFRNLRSSKRRQASRKMMVAAPAVEYSMGRSTETFASA
jgi:hypothetical protein